ncbi:MAG: hypothetical protein CMG61_06200 [Candidatus Marinimicrobia bacterium]|nr:hypothetical protein [Candidatus Neomarinimicrobiota bacterium]
MKINNIKFNFLNWKFILSIVISIVFSYYAFQEFELSKIIKVLIDIQYSYILLAAILLIFSVYIRALRWQSFFSEIKPSTYDLFGSQMIGYFGNNTLPLRAGEFLKCIFLSNTYKVPKSIIFGTVLLERFLDFMSILIIALVSIFFISINFFDQSFRISLIVMIFLLSIAFILIYKFKFRYNGHNRFLEIMLNIIKGFRSLKITQFFLILIYTLLIWFIYIVVVYSAQLSMNMNLTYTDVIIILIISSLALSIPSAPANIGAFEYSVVFSMGLLGYYSNAIEFAIILHLVSFIPYTILGGLFFIYYNYTLIDEK